MMRSIRLLPILILLLLGCANSLLNPYSDDFKCPPGYDGDCTTVTNAYNRSFKDEAFSPMVKQEKPTQPIYRGKERYSYQEELYKELAGLIRDPETPYLVPAKQLRVLIPGYVDKDENYYGHRYIYFIARPQKWALQELVVP